MQSQINEEQAFIKSTLEWVKVKATQEGRINFLNA
jgi:hypothetical protein